MELFLALLIVVVTLYIIYLLASVGTFISVRADGIAKFVFPFNWRILVGGVLWYWNWWKNR